MAVALCQIYTVYTDVSNLSNSLKLKTVHAFISRRSKIYRMPKRSYPFEDNLLPQFKLHVGEKQVNNGVSRDELMKEIYGKTMDLLKDGVKNLSKRLNNSMELNPVDVPASERSETIPSSSSSSCKPAKQMRLTNNLELVSGDKAVKDVPPRHDICGCGRVIDRCEFIKCSYCDQDLCNSCMSECVTCSELFCSNCCLPVYEYDQEDKHKCLSCYK